MLRVKALNIYITRFDWVIFERLQNIIVPFSNITFDFEVWKIFSFERLENFDSLKIPISSVEKYRLTGTICLFF